MRPRLDAGSRSEAGIDASHYEADDDIGIVATVIISLFVLVLAN